MKSKPAIMSAAFSLAMVIPYGSAGAAVIDFENFDLQGQGYLLVGSPLSFTNVSDSGINVTIIAGESFSISRLSDAGGAPLGLGLIDYLTHNSIGTTILFNTPVAQFSLRAGDSGSDDDTPLKISAFDAANTLIGTSTTAWNGGQFPPLALLSIDAPGIRKIVYTSGGALPGSTYIDDLTFSTIPEPSSMALAALGVGGALSRRSRRR